MLVEQCFEYTVPIPPTKISAIPPYVRRVGLACRKAMSRTTDNGTSRYRSTTTPMCVVFWRDTVLHTCASTLNIPVVHREKRSRGPISERGCLSTKAPGVARIMEHAMGYKQIIQGFSSLRP